MPLYCGIGGVKHKISGLYTGAGGVKKELTEIWTAEGGVKKLVYQSNAINPILNNNSWDVIRQASDDGVASSIWAVGDRKAVTLTGKCSKLTFSNETYYVYILGFDHNSSIEGTNRIHFQFGYTALSGGVHVAFVSGYRDDSDFYMNSSRTNANGWKYSFMRNTVCSMFKNCLPSDLQSVMKSVVKYSDNKGGTSNAASNVTASRDNVFILSEYEVFGIINYANSAEKSYQSQYEYYKKGNSKLRYRHTALAYKVFWWLRSVAANSSEYFCNVSDSADQIMTNADYSIGFAPAFCV